MKRVFWKSLAGSLGYLAIAVSCLVLMELNLRTGFDWIGSSPDISFFDSQVLCILSFPVSVHFARIPYEKSGGRWIPIPKVQSG